MTATHVSGSATAAPISHGTTDSLGRVIGSVLLVPRLSSSVREPGACHRGEAGLGAGRRAEAWVGSLGDTQLGEFRGRTSRLSGQTIVESQSPARVQVCGSVQPPQLRADDPAGGDHMGDKLPRIRRFSPLTLVARKFRPSPEADGLGGAGVLAGTLEFHGVTRPVTIPIAFTIDGTLLHGQGCFTIDLTDFVMTLPQRRRLEGGNDITIEVHLLLSCRESAINQL